MFVSVVDEWISVGMVGRTSSNISLYIIIYCAVCISLMLLYNIFVHYILMCIIVFAIIVAVYETDNNICICWH